MQCVFKKHQNNINACHEILSNEIAGNTSPTKCFKSRNACVHCIKPLITLLRVQYKYMGGAIKVNIT